MIIIKFKIVNILHSGRKGIRNEETTESKYDGLKGSTIEMKDPESIKQFESLDMRVYGSNVYSWWETSPVIALSLNLKNQYVLETVNTIYILERLTEEKQDNEY